VGLVAANTASVIKVADYAGALRAILAVLVV